MEDQDKEIKAPDAGNVDAKKRDAAVVKRFSGIIKFIRENPDVDILIPADGEPSVVSGLDPATDTDTPAVETVSADPTERQLDRHRLSELLSAGQRIGVQIRGHHPEAHTWAQAVQAYRNEFGL